MNQEEADRQFLEWAYNYQMSCKQQLDVGVVGEVLNVGSQFQQFQEELRRKFT